MAAGGPEAVRVEALAQALGVSKGGFYWHFENRKALLGEMLDRWERESVAEAIEQAEAGGGDARSKLRRLFALAASHNELLLVDLAVRDWARRDKSVAARLRRVDNQRMDYLRSQFREFSSDEDEVEARCMTVASLWIGNHFLAAEHGPRSRTDVMELTLKRLLA